MTPNWLRGAAAAEQLEAGDIPGGSGYSSCQVVPARASAVAPACQWISAIQQAPAGEFTYHRVVGTAVDPVWRRCRAFKLTERLAAG